MLHNSVTNRKYCELTSFHRRRRVNIHILVKNSIDYIEPVCIWYAHILRDRYYLVWCMYGDIYSRTKSFEFPAIHEVYMRECTNIVYSVAL